MNWDEEELEWLDDPENLPLLEDWEDRLLELDDSEWPKIFRGFTGVTYRKVLFSLVYINWGFDSISIKWTTKPSASVNRIGIGITATFIKPTDENKSCQLTQLAGFTNENEFNSRSKKAIEDYIKNQLLVYTRSFNRFLGPVLLNKLEKAIELATIQKE